MYPWHHNRRFNSYAEYLKKEFGGRVQKLSIDAGFTCPNRDGAKGEGGCTFCDNDAFNPSYCNPVKSITQQIKEGIEFHKVRYRRARRYLAYFQAYSNTYAPLEKLEKLYDEALAFPEVSGLVIGTRPDCIDQEKLDYFDHLSKTHYIILEYGIESCYNQTLERINRGHTLEDSIEALEMTAAKGIRTGVHMIFGLPGESKTDMLEQAGMLSSLPIDTIKFHQLQIIKGTMMAKEFRKKPEDFIRFSLEAYIDFIISFIENLNPNFVIERFAGEVPPRYLAISSWKLIRYDRVLDMIEKRLEELDSWQGMYFND
jgi:radical SAM protein (TIGR01212 family)